MQASCDFELSAARTWITHRHILRMLVDLRQLPVACSLVTVHATHRPLAPTPIGSSARTALVGGILASLALGLGMLLLRSTAGVRSIPERLLEWMLLLIPPGAFEATLQRFGFDAKRYGLNAAVLAMLVLFAWLGYDVLRRRWPIAALGLLGPGVWLVIMLLVMPLTSAGLFAI